MTDDRIRQIMKQETELPRNVEERAAETLRSICGVRAEGAGRYRRKGMCGEQTGNGNQKSSRNAIHYMKAAAASLVILAAAGTGVYAAGNYFGLFDYFYRYYEMEPDSEAEKLLDFNVEGLAFSNQYIDFTVRESLCDDRLIYMLVEAAPKEDDYLLLPQDYMEEDSAAYLKMEGISDGTIGEYAASEGKELVWTGIALINKEGNLLSCSVGDERAENGSLYFYITGTHDAGEENIDLTCVGTAYTKEMSSADRVEAECTVTNSATGMESNYELASDDITGDTGIVVDQIKAMETGLGVFVTFEYHIVEGAEDNREGLVFSLTDRDSNDLKTLPGYAGSGTEIVDTEAGVQYTRTVTCQKSEAQQGIFVQVKNLETDETYGPYELVKKQDNGVE